MNEKVFSRNHIQRSVYILALLLLPAITSLADQSSTLNPGTSDDTKSGRLFRERILPLLRDNCFQCHGVIKSSGLDLRSKETLLHGGAHGAAIVSGQPEASRLIRYVSGLEKIQMPPGKKLSMQQVSDLKAWVKSGAAWGKMSADDTRPWAFRKVSMPPLPKVRNSSWARNPIDLFILSKLEAKGLHPSPRADKRTLIRRATYDLIGLPPTPQQIDSFLADNSPKAYDNLIDRLLASPQYGERWARRWLDLARYAESEGFKSDEIRPAAWRYRDYVIQSFNSDKPYDRFIKEQLAGDELFPSDPDALVATGFCRHWPDESNARNLRLRRQEILNDITDTTGSVFLGLTIGCARCHDHKYDPIPQKDYYRLQSFFAAVQPRTDMNLMPPDKRVDYETKQHDWEVKSKEIRAEIETLAAPMRRKLSLVNYNKFPVEVQQAIDLSKARRTPMQSLLYEAAQWELKVTDAQIGAALKGEEKTRWETLSKHLAEFDKIKPPDIPQGIGITDVGPVAPKTYTLAIGVYDKPVEEVAPGFLSILDPQTCLISSPMTASTGRRTALANWISSADNPLTSRVLVNRIWQYHFGRGIVPTSSDFGNAGEPPTHPELLDYLSASFTGQEKWSLKKLHRLIMTSAAYQQSTDYNIAASKTDPDNTLLWRFRRRRLEGEELRDAILTVSGQINSKMGGPSIMPELPAGVTTRGNWKETADLQERNRRSIYVFVKRNLRYPLFEAFDMPDTHETCGRRQVTTTAIQSLMLLNDELILRSAQNFAGRVIIESGNDTSARIEKAYRLAFSRSPDNTEREAASAFLKNQTETIRARMIRRENILNLIPMLPGSDPAAGAALVDFCHALLNANEFLYID